MGFRKNLQMWPRSVILVPGRGFEPPSLTAADFKSAVFTDFTTLAARWAIVAKNYARGTIGRIPCNVVLS